MAEKSTVIRNPKARATYVRTATDANSRISRPTAIKGVILNPHARQLKGN